MIRMSAIGFGVFIALQANWAYAYELETHSMMTLKAVQASKLGYGKPLLNDLGIDEYVYNINKPISMISSGEDSAGADPKPFGVAYCDFSADSSSVKPRFAHSFENSIILNQFQDGLVLDNSLLLESWLMRGAIREDDGGFVFGVIPAYASGEPLDDPTRNINRWCNHFYNPLDQTALSLAYGCPNSGLSQPAKSPDWAMGTVDAAKPGMGDPSSLRRNYYSMADAKESLYRAVTGKNFKTGEDIDKCGTSSTFEARKRYWATLFRSLGDVLHLNQDMAQPQHTRNEPHGGSPLGAFDLLTGHKSVYESLVENWISGKPSRSAILNRKMEPISVVVPAPVLNLFPAYIPDFQDYTEFWSTAIKFEGQTPDLRKGLADYSNAGFFTPANNIGGTFNLPINVAGVYDQKSEPDIYDSTKKITYLVGTVDDHKIGSTSPQIRLLTKSSFGSLRAFYSMDENVYQDMAGLLLPRAVGYSAGIINHFFRGSMEISLPKDKIYSAVDQKVESTADTSGFRKVKVVIKNTTPAIDDGMGTYPQDMSGKLMMVVKFHLNTCYKSDISGEWGESTNKIQNCRSDEEKIVTSDKAPAGADPLPTVLSAGGEAKEATFDFSSNPVPINATDIYIQIVFRGVLGTEQDAVVVATKDIAEPTHVVVHNTSKYYACINGAWQKLNATPDSDGSYVPAGLKQSVIIPGYNITYVEPLRTNALPVAFRLNDDGSSSAPFNHTFAMADNLEPGDFIRLSVLTESGTPFIAASSVYGVWGMNLEAAVNDVKFEPQQFTMEVAQAEMNFNVYSFGLLWTYRTSGSRCTGEPPGSKESLTGADGAPFPPPNQVQAIIQDPKWQ